MRHVQSLVWGLEVECLGFSVVSKAWFGGWRSKIEGLGFRVTEIFACSLDTDEQFPHRGEGADYTQHGGLSDGGMGTSRTAGEKLETRN